MPPRSDVAEMVDVKFVRLGLVQGMPDGSVHFGSFLVRVLSRSGSPFPDVVARLVLPVWRLDIENGRTLSSKFRLHNVAIVMKGSDRTGRLFPMKLIITIYFFDRVCQL